MTRFLITLLIRLTDIPSAPTPDKRTEDWLAESYMREGFRQYLSGRERKLQEYLSRGIGAKPVSRDDYLLGFGQLQELMNLTNLAKACYENKQTELARKKAVVHTSVDRA